MKDAVDQDFDGKDPPDSFGGMRNRKSRRLVAFWNINCSRFLELMTVFIKYRIQKSLSWLPFHKQRNGKSDFDTKLPPSDPRGENGQFCSLTSIK